MPISYGADTDEEPMTEEKQKSNPDNYHQTRAISWGSDLAAEAAELEFRRNVAVVIGIDDYQYLTPLRTAGKDSQELARILQVDYDYEVRTYLNEQVSTRNQFKTTLALELTEHDRLLFYFAGHGVALDNEDGPAGYLIPQAARPEDPTTFLPMQELHDTLDALACRHLLVILDCCFAGAFSWAATREVQLMPKVVHQEQYRRFIRDRAWQVITSAAYDQKALDTLSGEVIGAREGRQTGAHSPFALALFEALRGAGDVVPAGGGDGVITATELYLFLRDAVELGAEQQRSHRQTPGIWPLRKHDKGEYIFLLREPNLPPAPELNLANNPYRGLEAFEEEHHELFFGRSRLIKALAAKVSSQLLTIVSGASGTGKSSLVKAGLVPYLKGVKTFDRHLDPDQPDAGSPVTEAILGDIWRILPPLRPTKYPLRQLELLLAQHLALDHDSTDLTALHRDPQALTRLVTNWTTAHPGRHLLLVIDQFEELLTLGESVIGRSHFLTLLADLNRTNLDHVHLVLTLRADFEPRFAGTIVDETAWMKARVLVPAMSPAEFREAIEGPASVKVLYFDPPELVDRLVDEVNQTPGPLPLLSFTLSEMYKRYVQRQADSVSPGERTLTLTAYEALGGVAGSLEKRASEEYEQLDEAHQDTMRRLMLRMVAIDGNEVARRPVPQAELIYADPAENERVEIVRANLIKARLLVGNNTDEGVILEPAHDTLVRAWEQFAIWQREEGDKLPLQRRLTQAATDWEDNNRADSHLWHNNARLPQVEEYIRQEAEPEQSDQGWLVRPWVWSQTTLFAPEIAPTDTHWLNQLELVFVQQSINLKRRNLRRLIGTVVAIIIVLTGLTIFAFLQQGIAEERRIAAVTSQANADDRLVVAETAQAKEADAAATAEADRDEAQRQARIALSRQLTVQSELLRKRQVAQLPRSVLFAAQAWQLFPNLEAEQTLRQGVSLLPGNIIARIPHAAEVLEIVFSPDGKYIATRMIDHYLIGVPISVWETQSGREVARLEDKIQPDRWVGLSFSPDGRYLNTASPSTAVVWEVASGQEVDRMTHEASSWGFFSTPATFSHDGEQLASLRDNMVEVWEVSTGHNLTRIARQRMTHAAAIRAATFSKDGQYLATAGEDNIVKVWEAISAQEVASMTHTAQVTALAFSPDGKHLVTATGPESFAYHTYVWEVPSGRAVTHTVHGSEVTKLAFSEDGQYLATAGGGSTARVWQANDGNPVGSVTHEGLVRSIAFSPDGNYLATGSDDGTARLWEMATGQEVARMSHTGDVTTVIFSPNGKYLATVSGDNIVRIWEVSGRPDVVRIDHFRVSDLRLSPDGQYLATVVKF
jgi:WD40 repeat protein